MGEALGRLEEIVDAKMTLFCGFSDPDLDAATNERVKLAIRQEALRLRESIGWTVSSRLRGWLTAAAIVLAVGLSWQLRSPGRTGPSDNPGALLSDWSAALDQSAAVTGSLVSEPWLPDDWGWPSDIGVELDEMLKDFDRAFDELGV